MHSLEQLVSAGFIRCARAMRASGLQALDLMTQDARDLDTCSCPVERQKWGTILEVRGWALQMVCCLACVVSATSLNEESWGARHPGLQWQEQGSISCSLDACI